MHNFKYYVIIMTCTFLETDGFLFDQVSNSLNCKGISLMCPMMCRHLDASGCVTCDCNTFDPSNPGGSGSHSLPSGTHTGNGTGDPSNPAGGDPSQPGASNHYDPSHPLASGNGIQTTGGSASQSTLPSASQATLQALTMTSFMTSTQTPQFSTKISPPLQSMMSSNQPPSVTSSFQQSLNTQSTSLMSTSTSITNFPLIMTTFGQQITSRPAIMTSTPAPFICPGVFNCSLDCTTGYQMNPSGCPLCQCAPIPTGLP
ncbi:sialidase-like isoform X1 [Dreissena polymorpha]|uniref:Antistasin-like domain-containing protein n=2 Tax=Dreissena polymorpha TaxID=45954 RepID=A0A9D4RB87_DREPO|nr:sialidase-like [Dreissena polymorpha]XP_052261364.1 sialidase-like isoform X1 [Dreissena polymorpha]KAH3859995.1 hypothetical protein DPMN_022885 [Dreissena polymorpha]